MVSLRRTFTGAAAVIGWFGVALQYSIVIANTLDDGGGVDGVIHATIDFLSYFTILSNIMVASVLTAALFERGPERGALSGTARRSAVGMSGISGRLGRLLCRPSVRAGVAVYIIVVGVVYSVMLRSLFHPQGLALLADAIVHDIMPVVYTAWLLLFVPPGGLAWRHVPLWLSVLIVYLAYSLVRGALTGFYPYPFIDVAKIGYGGVAVNALTMLACIIMLCLLIVALDRSLFRSAGAAPGEARLSGNRPR